MALDSLTGAGEPTVLKCGRASQSFFRTFRVQPILGRAFTRAEDQPGAAKVILLPTAFGSGASAERPTSSENRLTLDGVPHTVIGVLGPGFRFPGERIDALIPLAMDEAQEAKRDAILILPAFARLKDGITAAQARVKWKRSSIRSRRRTRDFTGRT